MKTIIVLCLLIGSIAAFPQKVNSITEALLQNDERLVSSNIIKAIEGASQSIKDSGLDPYHIERYSLDYALPVPVLFNTQVFIENLLLTGLSDFRVINMNYNVITNRLTFDIQIPQIEFTLANSKADATLFGSSTDCLVKGRLAIVGIQIVGNVRISIGLISGISIRSMSLKFSVNDIESELTIQTHGRDFSAPINRFLGEIVPGNLRDFSDDINKLLEILATQLAEELL